MAARDATYITRKFPPAVGGMETLAMNTKLALDREYGTSGLLALRSSNWNLLWWVPVTAARLAVDVAARRSKTYLFGDALTWALLSWIPRLGHVPALTMVCGLDITYSNPLYRAVVHRSLRKAPRVLAISPATLEQAVKAGVPSERAKVVTMGLAAPTSLEVAPEASRAELVTALSLPADAVILLTTGRLVRRKGVRWFVDEVMPRLDSRFHYVVVGTGGDREAILAAAVRAGVAERVHLLGYVSDDERRQLLNGSDLFVQPNIPVDNDMEGFGLVVVESAQAGLLTVAADLEGLRDAVRSWSTGVTVPSADAAAWATTLAELAARDDRQELAARFRDESLRTHSIDAMGAELRHHICAVGGL